jgi:predicted ATP-grasp superfamily ATP-dependent carboligase
MKILITGVSVRAMTESAVHSGYTVIALDAFGDRDLTELAESYSLHRDFRFAYSSEALFKASQKLSFDAVAYTSNLENKPEILECFSDSHRILGNSPKVVASVRNWPDLLGNLKSAGFPVPETIFSGKTGPVNSERRWLLKPVFSGGGHGICFYNPQAQPRSGSRNGCCAPGFMLQEYIPGKPCSASFVANGKDCTVVGISEQLVGMQKFGSQGFRYCGNLLPIRETMSADTGKLILDKVRRLAEFLTKDYGLVGLNGIDFIFDGDQIYFTEVNPRYTASMEIIEIAYELPMFHLHMQSILDGKLPEFDLEAELKRGKPLGKGYIYAEKDLTVPDTGGWFVKGIHDIPLSGEKIREGGPVCTILAGRSTVEETLSEIIRRAQELKEELYG